MLDPEKLKICVHCGLCLEACPTYRVLKNEADSPRGRILLMRGVVEGRIPMTETVQKHLDACLDCRACEPACPAGVPYGELIEEGRSQLYPQLQSFQKKERFKRFLLTEVLGKPARLKFLGTLLKLYQRSGLQALIRKTRLLEVFPHWMKSAEALLPSYRPFPPSRLPAAPPGTKSTIALLRGCIASVLFPQVEQAAVNTLRALGYEVEVPQGQTCCGALLLHGGFKEDAIELAKTNLKAFGAENYKAIVVTAAGCGSALKEYQRILPDLAMAKTFSGKITDITQMILQAGIPSNLHSLPVRVAYQDACHLIHAQGIHDEPRQILKAIPQLELVELPHSDWCCGSAGIYNLTHPEIAEKLLEEKVNTIASVKPDVLAVGNPGCTLQIQKGLREAGLDIPVVHPIELFYQSLSGKETILP